MVTLSYTQTWLGETDWQRVTLNILLFKVGPKPDVFGGGNDMVSQMKLITFKYLLEIIWGCVKTPHPFKWFFQTPDVIVSFSSYRFSKRWLHTLIKEFTWARKGKRKRNSKWREKRKGRRIEKGEEKERERKRKGQRKSERDRKKKAKGKGKENERKRNGKRKRKRKGKRTGEGKGRVKEEKTKSKGRDRKKERKGRGKGGRKGSVSHGPFLMPKVIVFVIVFVFVLLSFVNPVCVCSFFLEMAAIIKKGV